MRAPVQLGMVAILLPLCAYSAAEPPERDDAPFWQERQRGWHFYEAAPQTARPEPPRPAVAPVAAPASAPSAAGDPPELLEFARLQKLLEELRTIAIVRPSEDNVRRYLEQEAQVVERASRFAEMAQRVAWQSPSLDPTVQGGRPVNALALDASERSLQDSRAATMRQLSGDHALFFFYRSDCPYCHAFAPVLAQFGRRWNMNILPISLDGGALAEFPAFKVDNGIATTLRVQQVPALYLASPGDGQITSIGFGVLSDTQLLERITTLGSLAASAPGTPLRSTVP